MGLSLTVGILEDLEGDEEARTHVLRQFAHINSVLASADIDPHDEPAEAPDGFAGDMGGYAPLHVARATAARLWMNGQVKQTSRGEDPRDDPALRAYYQSTQLIEIADQPHTWVHASDRGHGTFDHLIYHSDAEGYYLPVGMEHPLSVEFDGSAETVGAVGGLLSECRRLARACSIPPDVLTDLDRACDGLDEPDLWGGFGVEAHALATLMAACRASNRSGAALVFH